MPLQGGLCDAASLPLIDFKKRTEKVHSLRWGLRLQKFRCIEFGAFTAMQCDTILKSLKRLL